MRSSKTLHSSYILLSHKMFLYESFLSFTKNNGLCWKQIRKQKLIKNPICLPGATPFLCQICGGGAPEAWALRLRASVACSFRWGEDKGENPFLPFLVSLLARDWTGGPALLHLRPEMSRPNRAKVCSNCLPARQVGKSPFGTWGSIVHCTLQALCLSLVSAFPTTSP